MKRRSALLVVLIMILPLALLPAPAGAGGFCSGGEFTDRATTEVTMVAMCFSPTVARVEKGATVIFTNVDSARHAIGGVNNIFGNLHTELAPGKSISYTFRDEGVFPYLCTLHPGMGGAIVVGDGEGPDTARAVTGSTGTEDRDVSAPTRPEPSSSVTPLWVALASALLGTVLVGTALRRRAGQRA